MESSQLLEDFGAIKSVAQHLSVEIKEQSDKLKGMEDRLCRISDTQKTILGKLSSIQSLLMQQRHHCSEGPPEIRPEEKKVKSKNALPDGFHFVYGHPYPTPWPNEPRDQGIYSTFAEQCKHKGPIPCGILFKAWFQDQLAVRFSNMEKIEDRLKIKNHFSETKTVVHVMLKHLRQYPKKEDDLDSLAASALKSIQQEHKLDTVPTRSRIASNWHKRRAKAGKQHQADNQRKSLFTEGKYADREFPPGTPHNIVQFFNTRGNRQFVSGKRKRNEEAD